MKAIRHVAFAATYAVVALVIGVVLSSAGEAFSPVTATLFGLLVFLAGALLHEFLARQEQADETARQLHHLGEKQREMVAAVERFMEATRADPTRSEVGAVVSEARMLETLARRMPSPELTAHPLASTPVSEQAVIEQIRDALRQDRVEVFLQPIVSLPQRKHRYYEVFSRVRGADGSTMMPHDYLAVAERTSLIAAFDNLLLFRCVQLIRETEKRNQNVGFFCNISAATLSDAAFMREFIQFMSGQNPSLIQKLVFELAQADLMEGSVFSTGFLDGLRRLGFRFSMDQVDRLDVDWDQLARHEIRFVKLDAARLLDPDGRFADPKKVTDLKHQLDRNNIDLIVEKIETDPQLLNLLDLRIDFGQGFLFGEPKLARRPG